MSEQKFERRKKGETPVLAICYDFDKTLSPDDMQSQGFIQSLGIQTEEFWKESNTLAAEYNMDDNLAYMYMMAHKAKGLSRDKLAEFGETVSFFNGVEDWFKRIKNFGLDNGVKVEHYIISSGLKEMIEGTSIYRNGDIDGVYAGYFLYNDQGNINNGDVWPAQVVNYTDKTQYLFRIEKGIIDVNDKGVNDAFEPEDIVVPFYNMVYIGDSDTDVPCMKLVNERGGFSVGVYDPEKDDKSKVYKMMREGRIKYFAPADYTDGSEMDQLVKAIILRTARNEELENIQNRCRKDFRDAESEKTREKIKKDDLIAALDDSGCFSNTHDVISEMSEITQWTDKEKERIFKIALANSQVFYILRDPDIKAFMKSLLQDCENPSDAARKVEKVLDKGYLDLSD